MNKAPQLLISTALESGALWLSSEPTRKLKSGRMSPYFFNAGVFCMGGLINDLSYAYADAIVASEIRFDVLYGPPYKGIPLASTTAMAVWQRHAIEVGAAYSRKELKDHGEGGELVGASLEGKDVVIIDDVITDGATKQEAIEFVRAHGGRVVAILIAFDREERGKDSDISGAQQVTEQFGIPVIAVATTSDLLAYLLAEGGRAAEVAAIRTYQAEYGAKAK